MEHESVAADDFVGDPSYKSQSSFRSDRAPFPPSPPGHDADAGGGGSPKHDDEDTDRQRAVEYSSFRAAHYAAMRADESFSRPRDGGGREGDDRRELERDPTHGSSAQAHFSSEHPPVFEATGHSRVSSSEHNRGSAHSRFSAASRASRASTLASDSERRDALMDMMGFSWKKFLICNICLAGIVVTVLVPVLVLGGGSDDGNGAAGLNATGENATTESVQEGRRRAYRSALLGLNGIPGSTAASLIRMRSPQSLALDFLLETSPEDDPLLLDPSDSSALAQRFALATLFYSTTHRGKGWDRNFGFVSREDSCRWNEPDADGEDNVGLGFPFKGAFCFDGSSVDSLVLPSNNLEGPIPPELSLLSNLEVLHLYSNALSGTLPPSITNLTELTILDLHGNRLRGAIPLSIGDNLTNLEHLDLSDNKLTGEIPKSLERLVTRSGSRLANLGLARNVLTGTVHAGWFYGGDRNDFGTGVGSSLRWLSLLGNYLSGEIPKPLSLPPPSSQLTDIWMYGNSLSGSIPSSMFSAHPNLIILGLSDNRITGTLPSEGIGLASSLRAVYLGRNKLRGTIPTSLGDLTRLGMLDLRRNRLSGSLPEGAFGGMRQLKELDLARNRLGGPLPASLGNATELEVLLLEKNRFTGQVPRSWARLTRLDKLLLANNSITGDVGFICENSDTSMRVFLADCHGLDSEVTCECCTACCSDEKGPRGELFGCFAIKDDIFDGNT